MPSLGERFQKWKDHFKNLLGSPSEITNKSIPKFVNGQLDVKLRQQIKYELVLYIDPQPSRQLRDASA